MYNKDKPCLVHLHLGLLGVDVWYHTSTIGSYNTMLDYANGSHAHNLMWKVHAAGKTGSVLSNLTFLKEKPFPKKETNHTNDNQIPYHFDLGIVQIMEKPKGANTS